MTDKKELAYIKRAGELNRACGLMIGALEAVLICPREINLVGLKKILSEAKELLDK